RSLVERAVARPARGHRGLRRLSLPRSLGLASGRRRHRRRPDARPDLSLAAIAGVLTRPGSRSCGDHLRLSQPRTLPRVSLAAVRSGLAFFGLTQPLPLLVAPV